MLSVRPALSTLSPPAPSPNQLADEAVCIGEASSSESYLNIPTIIAAAVSRGADAIHPVRCNSFEEGGVPEVLGTAPL